MITDRENENKVKKYATENYYTLVANTFGTLEYVKYCYEDTRTTEFLKWPKGSDSITIIKKGITKKIKLEDVKK